MIRRFAREVGVELAETAVVFVVGGLLLGGLFVVAFGISIAIVYLGVYVGLNPVLVLLGLLLLILAAIIIYRAWLRANQTNKGGVEDGS